MKYRQRNPACHAHPDTRPLPVKKTKRKRVERGKRKHIKGGEKMKETGPENRTSKENREGKAGNREGAEFLEGGRLSAVGAHQSVGWLGSAPQHILQRLVDIIAHDVREPVEWPRRLQANISSVCRRWQVSPASVTRRCVDPGAAPRFWKWGGRNSASGASRNFFWPPPHFLASGGGTKYCLDR